MFGNYCFGNNVRLVAVRAGEDGDVGVPVHGEGFLFELVLGDPSHRCHPSRLVIV